MTRRAKTLLRTAIFSLLALLPFTAHAGTIDRTLTVQVFRLCDDFGLNCASAGPAGDTYFASEVNRIWSQAGISVAFNPITDIDSTAYSFLDDSVFGDGFSDLAGHYGTHGPSNSIVDLFLVHTVTGVYGEGWLGAGGLVIAMDTVMDFNGGLGRIDTVAHELGHNFGLVPSNLGGDPGSHSTVPTQLMASGGIRSIPTTIADIAPNGLGYDFLPSDQIALARGSSLLQPIPEPAAILLSAAGLLALGTLRRRRA